MALLYLLRSEGKNGYNLHQCFHQDPLHLGRGLDLSVNLDAAKETCDVLEEFNKGIVTRTNIFDRLELTSIARSLAMYHE